MATLMIVGNSDGERRCDEKCYNAQGDKCECCCNGMNHSAGLDQAMVNTRRSFFNMIEEYQQKTGRKIDYAQVDGSILQEDFFK